LETSGYFLPKFLQFPQGIKTAKFSYSQAQDLPDKIAGIHLVLRGLMNAGGYWEEACSTCKELESLLLELIKAQPIPLPETQTLRLLTPLFSTPHVEDEPAHFRPIMNQWLSFFKRIFKFTPKTQQSVTLSDS
jgi:hypothetical protein